MKSQNLKPCLTDNGVGAYVPHRFANSTDQLMYVQEYARHREHEQEAAYNMGRAAHHLGLLHLAVQYYQKCLNSNNDGDMEDLQSAGQQQHLHMGLKREAAFNLSLIYHLTGADKLAAQVLRQHVSI